MQISGRSRATRRASPRRQRRPRPRPCRHRAPLRRSPRIEGLRIKIPRPASSSTILRPLHCFERRMSARASGAVAGRGSTPSLARRLACQDVRARSHAAADEHRLPGGAQGRAGSGARTECAGRALAVDEQVRRLPSTHAARPCRCCGRRRRARRRSRPWEEMGENLAGVVAKNLTIGQRAIDRRRAWRRGSAVADRRVDRCAGQFAVGQRDA